MTREIDIWVAESPVGVVEGEELMYSMTWTGKISGASASSKVYCDGLDVTSEIASGADSISNGTPPVQTLPTLRGFKGDKVYVVCITATVDGNKETQKLEIHAQKPGATM